MDPRLPERQPPTEGSFDTRPAQVEAWIGRLPLANLGETSRQLYHALLESNRLDIPAEQRFRMLELLRVPLQTAGDAMKKHFVGKQFPLAVKSRQIAELAQALLNQMALGYLIVVEDSGYKRGFLRDSKLTASASHRALTYLGLTLLRAYQVYAPYPLGVWRWIHGLYQNAEVQGFATTAIKDSLSKTNTHCQDVYKRILLLALACPYRLRQGEVEQVYTWLADWTQYASLETLTQNANPTGLFVANCDSDDPPSYIVLRDVQYNCKHCRLLNATRLADVMRDAVARQRRENGPRSVNEQALRRLMLAWGVMPKRRYSRSHKHSSIAVAMGLSATHYFISGEEALAGDDPNTMVFDNPAHFEANETRSRRPRRSDPWTQLGAHLSREEHNHSSGSQYIEFEHPTQKAKLTAANPSNSVGTGYRTYQWKMINISAGGYRLLWDSSETSQAQVGELLGLREHGDDDFHLSLGVVRWMKCGVGTGLELGVEMLSPGAVAVGTRILKGKTGSEYMRSLLLPAIKAINQPATLLTSALPYHVGDTVIVNSHGKEARVELTKLVENTGTFAQFQFHPLDSQSSTSAGSHALGDSPNFDALWEQI